MDRRIAAGAGAAARGDRLRILLVTSDLFPPFRPAAKAIFAEELTRRGHRIDWLMQAESASETTGARPFGNGVAHVAATDLGPTRLRRLRKHWLDFKNDCRVFGLLRKGEYSLVQVKDKYLGALLAMVAARRRRVPLFYWLAYPHADASMYAASRGVARYRLLYLARGKLQKLLLLKVILPAARHVFVQSEQMREDLAAEGVPRDKMTPVPSSVNLSDLETPPDARPRTVRPAGERWMVYLGTLIRERQLDFLVRVLAAVRRSEPGAVLLFVGRGEMPEDEARLMREAERLGVADAVRITGWMPMKDAWDYVRAADVCLSPYCPIPILRSTSPTKLVEYMALGKPVVANDHPEQSLVLRQSGAGLVCPWDEERFAEAVLEAFRDERRASAMGAAGRAYVEQHRTHSRLSDVVESCYSSLLDDGVGGSRTAAWGVPE